MGKTTIGWCSHSWNALKWWCTKKSEGCSRCYMMRMAAEHPNNAADHAVWREAAWKELRSFPSGATIFAGDMYDWMHEQMPFDFIQKHLQAAQSRPDCTFLFLTKRAERMAEFFSVMPIPANVWLGVSVENRKRLFRLDLLRQIQTPRTFASVEPLLEDLGAVSWDGIAGVIVGGESGMEYRKFDKAWARTIRDQCERDGAAFYFKQSSDYRPGQDRLLDGRTHDDLAWSAAPDEADFQQQQSLF